MRTIIYLLAICSDIIFVVCQGPAFWHITCIVLMRFCVCSHVLRCPSCVYRRKSSHYNRCPLQRPAAGSVARLWSFDVVVVDYWCRLVISSIQQRNNTQHAQRCVAYCISISHGTELQLLLMTRDVSAVLMALR